MSSLAAPPIVERYQLPQKSFSITAKQIDETINLKDPEDAVKYMPSLFVRKRNDGDNQAVLATRTWGLNSSARTLIYDDDLLISALIGNNNSAAPRRIGIWSRRSRSQRIDFLNGPYAAAYPGNSMGGVLLITTKMPDKFDHDRQAKPCRSSPGTNTAPRIPMSAARPACRSATGSIRFSWLFSANLQDGFTQPLTYTTNATPPAGTTGTIPA